MMAGVDSDLYSEDKVGFSHSDCVADLPRSQLFVQRGPVFVPADLGRDLGEEQLHRARC